MTHFEGTNPKTWDSIAARLEQVYLTQEAEKQAFKAYNVERVAKHPEQFAYQAPLESDTKWGREMLATLDNDPRTRKATDTVDSVNARRAQARAQSLEKQAEQRAESSKQFESLTEARLKTMGIDPTSYQWSYEYERITEGGDED